MPFCSLLVPWVSKVHPGCGGELAGGGRRLLSGEVQCELMVVDLTITILVTPVCENAAFTGILSFCVQCTITLAADQTQICNPNKLFILPTRFVL